METSFYISGLFTSIDNPDLIYKYWIRPLEKSVFRYSIECNIIDKNLSDGWQKLTNAVNQDRAVAFILDELFVKWKRQPSPRTYNLDRIIDIWKAGHNEVGIVCDLPKKATFNHPYVSIDQLIPFAELIMASRNSP